MSQYIIDDTKKITVRTIGQMKPAGEKIAMLTAYDYTMARLVDAAGVDILLVGDSAANTMAGYSTTLPITLEEMMVYARGVVRGTRRALVVFDMPFGSYQAGAEQAVGSAVRVLKETQCDAVKMEGGQEHLAAVRRLVECGIPVMGHLGLQPQHVHAYGGFGLRATDDEEAARIEEDARLLEEAGCFAIVLEKIPAALAQKITTARAIPVIGIGAGGGTDGQVLVLQDMLGLSGDFHPKFLRTYADLGTQITNATNRYVADVKSGDYPSEAESY
ncbi:MAG: 3-methyl-2-oxobutanoate hydroxymethyltransferase [Bacteroidaceae bacterium]|nr:3-methyl-2-oxobutanoate hydroxymethyltransferase [Bacteroidaceae bacterium]